MSSSEVASSSSTSLARKEQLSAGFIPLRVRSDPSNPKWPSSPAPSETNIDVYVVLQHGGSLSFPKGRCEQQDGGSFLATAKRELEEESGLTLGELLLGETVFTDAYTFKHQESEEQEPVLISKTLHLFLATTVGEHITAPSSKFL